MALFKEQILQLPWKQLIQNGQFNNNGKYWTQTPGYAGRFEYINHCAEMTPLAQFCSIGTIVDVQAGHKYVVIFDFKMTNVSGEAYTNSRNWGLYSIVGNRYVIVKQYLGAFAADTNWHRANAFFTAQYNENIRICMQYDGAGSASSFTFEQRGAYFTNAMLIDLTETFGDGKEPTTMQALESKMPFNFYGCSIVNPQYIK